MSIVKYQIDYSDIAKVTATAANIASKYNDATVKHRFASLFFGAGAAAKEAQANVVPNMAAPFQAFVANHYAEKSGRKMPGEKSLPVIQAAFGGFLEAGFHPGYDALPVANWMLANSKGLSWSEQGALIRNILTTHPTTCPTEEEMLTLKPTKAPATAHSVACDAEEDLLAAFGPGGKYVHMLVTNEQKLAAIDAIAYVQALKACLPVGPAASGFDAKAEAAKLRAKMGA